jgi:hypothetical protein
LAVGLRLQAEKTELLDRMDEDFDGTLKDHLAAVNKRLVTARERRAYEAQIGRQN